MEFKRYKGFQHPVAVGQTYNANFEGLRYFYEIDPRDGLISYSSDNIAELSATLRKYLVLPNQLNNSGTESPIKTSQIKESLFESLTRMVSRPMLVVYQLPEKENHKVRENEDGLDSNLDFAVELGPALKLYKLDKVAKALNSYGAKESDVLFFRSDKEKYYPMSTDHKYHILASLK